MEPEGGEIKLHTAACSKPALLDKMGDDCFLIQISSKLMNYGTISQAGIE
jgi:hypothetical protein